MKRFAGMSSSKYTYNHFFYFFKVYKTSAEVCKIISLLTFAMLSVKYGMRIMASNIIN